MANDRRLIESVRQQPCLYDMTHPKYLDAAHKAQIWKQISEEIEQSEENCKKRWTNIRDHLKRSIKKRKTKSGQSAKNVAKYKYEDTLEFLLPHIQERDILTNLCSVSMEGEVAVESQKREEIQPLEDSNTCSCGSLAEPNNKIKSEVTPANRKSHKLPHQLRGASRASPTHQPGSASQALMEYLFLKKETEKVDEHPMDGFLRGVAPILKKFSPYYQHVARGRIFQIVQDLEYEQMQLHNLEGPNRSTIFSTDPPVHASTPTPTDEHQQAGVGVDFDDNVNKY